MSSPYVGSSRCTRAKSKCRFHLFHSEAQCRSSGAAMILKCAHASHGQPECQSRTASHIRVMVVVLVNLTQSFSILTRVHGQMPQSVVLVSSIGTVTAVSIVVPQQCSRASPYEPSTSTASDRRAQLLVFESQALLGHRYRVVHTLDVSSQI